MTHGTGVEGPDTAHKESEGQSEFRLSYATMFNPPEVLHERYDAALQDVKARIGREHAMLIDGQEVRCDDKFEDLSPINHNWVLGRFQKGAAEHAERALSAARHAAPTWSGMPWKERIRLLREVAKQIENRIYELGAVLSLEVGKNRMEALADAQEAADLIRYACDTVEANEGFVVQMGQDPLEGYTVLNTSVLRPYGVWVVISPFNFPAALMGGPMGAALVTGNTVVMKPASDTPWTGRLLAECLRAAGLPAGVFNYVTGGGGQIGEALIGSEEVDGITFTGSYEVGMHIYRQFAQAPYPRPIVLEMGGKNASIVSANADLERAAQGIVRSAFGLQGQKCSANSRILVQESVYDDLVGRIVQLTKDLKIGDPTERGVFLGPVINQGAYQQYQRHTEELSQAGRILTGGHVLTGRPFDQGYYCEPTVVADVPLSHHLWGFEMFLPITLVRPVDDLEQAMQIANSVVYGLTSGFYGSEEEAQWYFDHIQAGVNYANRPQGSTTGAWPGYQPFGGWKASGSTGKFAGGHYYLHSYMHEQIRTLVR
jgi:1-pyrroline-5-carboxylate dehydrogenase